MTYQKPPPPMDMLDIVFLISALVVLSFSFMVIYTLSTQADDAATERCVKFCDDHGTHVRSWDGVDCTCVDGDGLWR